MESLKIQKLKHEKYVIDDKDIFVMGEVHHLHNDFLTLVSQKISTDRRVTQYKRR